jgi:two-component system chemotaxis response regulator CheY
MSQRVLVVDDSSFMRSLLTKIIKKSSKIDDVLEAIDGKSAVEKYEKERPSLVTMDIDMPGMNGLEAAKKIKELDPNAKIVMVTSANKQEMKSEAQKIGSIGYITKPFNAEKIIEVIDKIG